jgi:hypothetical protein
VGYGARGRAGEEALKAVIRLISAPAQHRHRARRNSRERHHCMSGDRAGYRAQLGRVDQFSVLVVRGPALRGPRFATLDVTVHDLALARELGLLVTMHVGDGEWGRSRARATARPSRSRRATCCRSPRSTGRTVESGLPASAPAVKGGSIVLGGVVHRCTITGSRLSESGAKLSWHPKPCPGLRRMQTPHCLSCRCNFQTRHCPRIQKIQSRCL